MDSDALELLPVFLQEMQEHLDAYERALLRLEKENPAGPTLAELFRVLHTLKGGCSLFGFHRMGGLIHKGESLISALRDGKVQINPERTGTLLELGDLIRLGLDHIRRQGSEAAEEHLPLQQRFEQQAEPDQTAQVPALPAALPAEGGGSAFHLAQRVTASTEQLQVDVSLLNRLLDRASELLLLRQAFFQYRPALTRENQRDYQLLCLRYQALATEVQEALMAVRMQPIGLLWKTYPRLLRELEGLFGKQLKLETTGQDTELDKSVLDAIRDPLLHLLRNAVDHGIESPALRLQQGKAAEGTIRLSAYQDQGFIFVELVDDGQGLNWEAIRSKALEKGLLTPVQAETASQEVLLRLISHPGFSTAATITEISGRGVGLDVVHNNLARIGGALEVTSIAGFGTCFRLRLPLTLALLPALLIQQEGQILAIPQQDIRAILNYDELEVLQLGEGQCCRWRDLTLPLAQLNVLLGQPATPPNYCVILQSDHFFALAVEEVLEIREIAIKALGSHWQVYPLMAGASILASGEMALVLSLAELEAQICRQEAPESLPCRADPQAQDHGPSLLLLLDSQHALLALDLEQVLHLEVFAPEQLLAMPAGQMLSRRGELIPVLDLASALGGQTHQNPELSNLVICEQAGRKLGLLVEDIVDITAYGSQAIGPALRPGIRHSLELPGGAAEVLDPAFLWQQLWQTSS